MLIIRYRSKFLINSRRVIMKQSPSSVRPSSTKTTEAKSFIDEIHKNRLATAKSVVDFPFNFSRLQYLNKIEEVPEKKDGIAYWMARDQRVQDNWALLFAQKLALKHKVPVHVIFCLTDKFLNSPLRHYKFMLDGLDGVVKELRKLNINFHLLKGEHSTEIPNFVKNFNIGCLVCDFSPLRIHREWVDKIKPNLPPKIPFIQVDAHNVVPVWIASDKLEPQAYTIRKKIVDKLNVFLTEFPPLIKHPHKAKDEHKAEYVDWKGALDFVKADPSVGEITSIKPGYKAGIDTLESFIEKRLVFYEERNNPLLSAVSNLSPYFHFGQIAPHRAALEVRKHRSKASKCVDDFSDQSIVRRELSDNFCYYNENYDNFKGAPVWAQKTLNDHRRDKREYIYTLEEFEKAQTHDDLWNSAQLQMIKDGVMHRFLRMYWAKKILEWTKTPEEALEIAIYLNDRYNLDGRDPNGYNGIMWSIVGVHDHEFQERRVFGKIRIMTYFGTEKKFDMKKFINLYGGVVHHKEKN